MKTYSDEDYISVSYEKPNFGFCYEVNGKWLHVKKPLSQWPADLKKKYGRLVKILKKDISELYNSESDPTTVNVIRKEKVVLCEDVEACNNKTEGCNPACIKNITGICSSATMIANDGRPIRFETIAFFMGITKQRAAQIYKDAQKELVQLIMDDPVLSDICKKYGIKPPSF